MELQRLTTVFDVDTSGLQSGRVQVDAFFSDSEKRASDSVSRFDRISKQIGQTIGTGIKVGLGDVGAAVDSLISITEKGLSAIPGVGGALGAAFKESAGAMRDAVNEGLAWNDMMKRSSISLGLVAGGANDATKEMAGLRSISSNSEFGLPVLISAAEQLQIMQGNAHNVVPEIQAIADAASALGRGESGLNAIVNVLARINEMEKVSGRDAKALVNQGIPIYDIIGQAAGISSTRAKRLVDSGRVQIDDFTDALLGYFQKRYPEAAKQMAQTIEVQNAKLSSGMAALKGVAFQGLYGDVLQGYQDANAAIRGPQAGAIAAGINAAPGVVVDFIKSSLAALKSGDIFAGAQAMGDQIVEGVKKGIADKSAEAYTTVSQWSTGIIGTAKNTLGIQSPSTVFAEMGAMAVEGFANGSGGRGGLASEESKAKLRKALEDLLGDPAIQAFLKVIQKSEVGNDRNPYARAFGPLGHVDPSSISVFDSSTWPGMQVFSPTLGRKVWTHPYGPYQAEPGTYQRFARQAGINDVSPHSQDLFAAWDLRQHPEALRDVLGGDVLAAMNALKSEWESFAVNSPGKTQSLANLFYQLQVGSSAVSASNPLPVSVVSILGDITGGTGQFATSGAVPTAVAGPQAVTDVGGGPLAVSVTQLPLIPYLTGLDEAGKKQEAVFGQKAQRDLRGLPGELLQMGLDSKTVGDEFEKNFADAFDHIGEAGHNIFRDLGLSMLQDIKHDIGTYLAGELRDTIFGSADGKTKGLLSGLGNSVAKLFGGGGSSKDPGGLGDAIAGKVSAAIAPNTSVVAQLTQTVLPNTLATSVNTASIDANTAALQAASVTGGGKDGWLDFGSKFLEGALGGLGGLTKGGIGGDGSPIGTIGKVTPHASGGVASGWSVVGERGPELAYFGNPTRIYSNSDSRQMLGGQAVVHNHYHTWNVNAPAGFESFLKRETQSQIESRMATAMQRAQQYAYPQQ